MGIKQSKACGHYYHGAECNGVKCMHCDLAMRGVCRHNSVPTDQLHGIMDPYDYLDGRYYYFDWSKEGDGTSTRTYLYSGRPGVGYECFNCLKEKDGQAYRSAVLAAYVLYLATLSLSATGCRADWAELAGELSPTLTRLQLDESAVPSSHVQLYSRSAMNLALCSSMHAMDAISIIGTDRKPL